MKRNPIKLLLTPFALLYGIGVGLRNMAYNLGVFTSKSFDIPVVCIGNLSAGGTGKTPHTEYLIRLLKDNFQVATLSRGYGRKTKNYILATTTSSHTEIGDEPKQFKTKFPEIPVAVDANRVEGIENLLKDEPQLDIILLDDAFQHRAVKPEFSILLTTYSDLFIHDYLLPVGRLREWQSGYKRADIIIVTKCPEILSPLDRRAIKDDLKPLSYQSVYFSYFAYGDLQPAEPAQHPTIKLSSHKKVFLFTGIASTGPLKEYLSDKQVHFEHKSFPDHHSFTVDDIASIINEFNAHNLHQDTILVTTEKDFMRIKHTEHENAFKGLPLYYLPIEVRFHGNDGNELNGQILDYVKKNQIHRSVSQGQNID